MYGSNRRSPPEIANSANPLVRVSGNECLRNKNSNATTEQRITVGEIIDFFPNLAKFKIMNPRNETEAQSESFSSIPISFRKYTKTLDTADHIFAEDSPA